MSQLHSLLLRIIDAIAQRSKFDWSQRTKKWNSFFWLSAMRNAHFNRFIFNLCLIFWWTQPFRRVITNHPVNGSVTKIVSSLRSTSFRIRFSLKRQHQIKTADNFNWQSNWDENCVTVLRRIETKSENNEMQISLKFQWEKRRPKKKSKIKSKQHLSHSHGARSFVPIIFSFCIFCYRIHHTFHTSKKQRLKTNVSSKWDKMNYKISCKRNVREKKNMEKHYANSFQFSFEVNTRK